MDVDYDVQDDDDDDDDIEVIDSHRYINEEEVAGFQSFMKLQAYVLSKAVKSRKAVKKAYEEFIQNMIETAIMMDYPGAGTITLEDIVPTISDLKCTVTRKHMKGKRNNDRMTAGLDDKL